MAFFPTYKDNWTRTPNVFFDVIVKEATANQIRLVGYLIRQTIGYNREAKWAAVSRSTLIKEAGIPNGSIKDAIAGCEKKEWIIVFEQKQGKQERYIFLNDPLNQCIVRGLKQGCFTVADLEYLNLAGINKLLEKHGLLATEEGNNRSSTETGEGNNRSSTESVGVGSTESVGVGSTESVGVDKAKQQAVQGLANPLNTTSFKDISLKDNVVVVELFRKYMNVEITEEEAQLIVNESANYQKDVKHAIQETLEWAEINEKELTNPVGSVIYAIQKGWNLSRQTYRPKKKSAKQDQRKAEKKPADKEKVPQMLKMQMEQEQPQQPEESVDSVDPEERQRLIREKLRLMNEKFANSQKEKEKKPEHAY